MPTSSVIVAFQSITDKSSLLHEWFNTVPNLPLTLALKGYFSKWVKINREAASKAPSVNNDISTPEAAIRTRLLMPLFPK